MRALVWMEAKISSPFFCAWHHRRFSRLSVKGRKEEHVTCLSFFALRS